MADSNLRIPDAPDLSAFRRLPPPHSDVKVAIEPSTGHGDVVHICYIGPRDSLISCGAIEAPMAEPAAKRGGHREDSHGDRFRRATFKRTGNLCVERFVTSLQRVRQLPGVPSNYLPQDAHQTSHTPYLRLVVDNEVRT
jgi:hypothetical protein